MSNRATDVHQIMDSKMDSGYLGPGESHAQALEYDYDVARALSPAEVVGIMDQLLCLEVRSELQFAEEYILVPWAYFRQSLTQPVTTDGVAYGSSAVTDALHIGLPR